VIFHSIKVAKHIWDQCTAWRQKLAADFPSSKDNHMIVGSNPGSGTGGENRAEQYFIEILFYLQELLFLKIFVI
jgi:hypothetical protein